jgi:mannose-6-phosphate isomerase-like protein (cupin superfamily)
MSTPLSSFAVQPGEGTPLETPTGDWVTIKAHTGNTYGSLSVLEITSEPKSGPALHTHLREDELWWVLEGKYRFKAGESLFEVGQGGMAFGPRGTPHCFQNVGDRPGRLLVITTPSGVERFFEQFAELLPGPVDRDRFVDVALANWIEFIGPPLAVSDPI